MEVNWTEVPIRKPRLEPKLVGCNVEVVWGGERRESGGEVGISVEEKARCE